MHFLLFSNQVNIIEIFLTSHFLTVDCLFSWWKCIICLHLDCGLLQHGKKNPFNVSEKNKAIFGKRYNISKYIEIKFVISKYF